MAAVTYYPQELGVSGIGFPNGSILTTTTTNDYTVYHQGLFVQQQEIGRAQQQALGILPQGYTIPKEKEFITDLRAEIDEWLKDALV